MRGTRKGPQGFSFARMFRLCSPDQGQTAVEYVGMVMVVVLIIGGVVAAGVGTEVTGRIGEQICELTGGGDCGDSGGGDDQPVADDSNDDTDGDGQQPAGDSGEKTQVEKDYEKAVKELEAAQDAGNESSEKAKEAARELAKILAEELGITAAFDCITKGDGTACTETVLNVLSSLIGGAVGKLAAKYGAPWKWKKAAELVKNIKKHGSDLYDGIKGLIKNKKKVKEAQQKVDDLEKKLPEKEKKPTDPAAVACKTGHSFLSGTPVLLADGSRRAIERVREGDRVVATDPYTGLTVPRTVTATITTVDDKDFTRLMVKANSHPATITVTDTHPFWLTDQHRWADAGDIRPGAKLRTPSGAGLQVTAISHHEKRQRTYDLTVAGIHSYYVGIGSADALVHNCDWNKSFDKLPDGKQKGKVKVVKDVGELRKHFDEWTKGAEKLPARGDKIQEVYKLEDGTVIQWRKSSASGGETIDIIEAGKKVPKKVHIDSGS